MVSVGYKALVLRRSRSCETVGDSLMGGEEEEEHRPGKQGRRKKGLGRKPKKGSFGFDSKDSKKGSSGLATGKEERKPFKHQSKFEARPSVIRKQIDPETSNYFVEISNVLESGGLELEERSAICGNALEEVRGKEFELATDYKLSHTLESLLEGSDLDHLCGFLHGCAEVFPLIAMDRAGSHVAEAGLKSLVAHLQDDEAVLVVQETLESICKVIMVNPIEMMCDRYGSHVLRSLLCLFGGVPLDSPEYHPVKSSSASAERFKFGASSVNERGSQYIEHRFPSLLKFLVSEMLKCSKKDIQILLVDQYGSLVLQTALKLLEGHDEDLLNIIPILLGGQKSLKEGNVLELSAVGRVVEIMKQTAYSHLVEVILGVAPENLYAEMLTKVFRSSLFELSSDQCGNFVVQALISRTRNEEHIKLIWGELGTRFTDLLEMGHSGVIVSLLMACQRLEIHDRQCAQALVAAVCSPDEDTRNIVPRILFLDNYFACNNRPQWNWPDGAKMHINGSRILQAVFRFSGEIVQKFAASITSMEDHHTVEVVKDSGGARVIEAYLDGNASAKLKRRLIMKLKGHFGELAMHSSSSFTVLKCFSASNLSLREAIASELLDARTDLARTKQGPYLLRKLNIDGFANRPDQWRSEQESKQSVYNEFSATFGSTEAKSSKSGSFLSSTPKPSTSEHPNDIKRMREEIGLAFVSGKRTNHATSMASQSKKYGGRSGNAGPSTGSASRNATGGQERKPFLSFDMKKRASKDAQSNHSRKKQKT